MYAKWEKNPAEPINPNDEIMSKDTCYPTDEELEKFKGEAFRTHSAGNRVYQQAGAFILMLNTGLRTGELLGVLNSDIDLENNDNKTGDKISRPKKRWNKACRR